MIRPFIPLLLAFIGMIFIVTTINYHKIESPLDRVKLNQVISEISDDKNDYILTIGSSTHDVGNPKPFPVLLQEALDKQNTWISVHGIIIHGGVSRQYYKCLELLFLKAKEHSLKLPKLIIIEVNPRSFSTYYTYGYYTNPVSWSRSAGYYSDPPLLSILELGWERWIVGYFPTKKLCDFSDRMRADIFNYFHLKYPNYFEADNIIDLINLKPVIHPIGYKLPLLGSFYGEPISKFLLEDWRKLASLAKENHTQILFYITPINSHFNSPEATLFYRLTLSKNRQILDSAFSNMGAIKLVDLSDLIDSNYFLDCEHLKPPALQKLANRIADEIMELPLYKQMAINKNTDSRTLKIASPEKTFIL